MRIPTQAIVLASSLLSFDLHSAERLSRDQALVVARKTVHAQGIDIAKYELAAFKRELSDDGKEWTFLYECKRKPSPPGCFFWVSVDRITGVAKYMPGE